MKPANLTQNNFVKACGAALERLRLFMSSPLALRLVFSLFIVQAVVLVFTVKIGVPPDEQNHIAFIQFYAQHSLSPVFNHQQPTYNLGDKTREVDYLYHYVMSLLVRVMPFSTTVELHIIRLVSVLVGVLSFALLAKVFKRLGISAAVIATSILILTNIPMVLMMSSAINNDALVWLGLALGLWLLVRLWERPTATDLIWLFALAVSGGLVKRTLLPLGLMFGVVGLVVLVRNFRLIVSQLRRFNWQIALAIIVLLIGMGLFAERVGGNIVRYGGITVTCEQVQGEAACYNFWGNIRARYLATLPPEKPIAPPLFAFKWLTESFNNVVDIQTQGWRHEVKPARWMGTTFEFLIVIGAGLGVIYEIRRLKTDKLAWRRLTAIGICVFFMFVHLLVNFGEYKKSKFFGIALNGRYIIPCLLPLTILAGFYYAKTFEKYPKLLILATLALVIATIFGTGLIMMFRNPQLMHG